MSKPENKARKPAAIKPISQDPRYAAARPWDWHVCLDCHSLVPVLRCPKCGGLRFTSSPKAIIRQATAQHGLPPSPFDRNRDSKGKTG